MKNSGAKKKGHPLPECPIFLDWTYALIHDLEAMTIACRLFNQTKKMRHKHQRILVDKQNDGNRCDKPHVHFAFKL